MEEEKCLRAFRKAHAKMKNLGGKVREVYGTTLQKLGEEMGLASEQIIQQALRCEYPMEGGVD